jgi:hypothetical protein
MNSDDAIMRIDEEDEEEEDDDDPDEDDVRLQGLFRSHDGDAGNNEVLVDAEQSNDIIVGEIATGNDRRKRRRLDNNNNNNSNNSNKLLIHEDAIMECFHLAVTSHDANHVSRQHQEPSKIKQRGDDGGGVELDKSTTGSSDCFRWKPPLLHATTSAETETPDADSDTLADWQPQSLELPQWALAMVCPSREQVSIRKSLYESSQKRNKKRL